MFVCFVIFQPVHNADFIVPVEIDGTIHQVSYYLVKLLQPSVFKWQQKGNITFNCKIILWSAISLSHTI